MTVIMHDVRSKLNTPKQKEPIPGVCFADVLYADDTLIFGTCTRNLNKLMAEIENESKYYNMRLNYDKCVNLTLNRKQSMIRFGNREVVPRKPKATYLGAILTDTNDNHAEVNNRIADCIATANRLKVFWNKAANSTR